MRPSWIEGSSPRVVEVLKESSRNLSGKACTRQRRPQSGILVGSHESLVRRLRPLECLNLPALKRGDAGGTPMTASQGVGP